MSGESPRKSATWTRGGPQSIDGETLSDASGSFKTFVEGGDERFYYCPQTWCPQQRARMQSRDCERIRHRHPDDSARQKRVPGLTTVAFFLKKNVASTTFSIPNVSLYNSRIKVFIKNKSIDFCTCREWFLEIGERPTGETVRLEAKHH